MANPDFVAPHFESIRFGRTPAADFQVGKRTYGVFSRDRVEYPIHQWQVENRLTDETSLNELTPPAPACPLSEAEFATAVRQALRNYTRPDLLATNPLLQSPLCANGARTPKATTRPLGASDNELRPKPQRCQIPARALAYLHQTRGHPRAGR